ncbi:MAG: dihydroorotate dehydrogenase [Gemmatimonadetes bacterium]|nr:dihydroorotate dehydrogenase [Gemmatimonadota bacterium]
MRLEVTALGTRFRNPVLLAAGTCGFGRELAGVADLSALGGFVTKSVTLEPRAGNPAPRVAESGDAMLNSVGLANPGLQAVRRDHLPWIRDHGEGCRVFVSVAGHTVDEFVRIVEGIDAEEGFLGFEINLSCPNDDRRGGPVFALDPDAVDAVIGACRNVTGRPLLAKLAPNDPDLERTVRTAEDAGADGVTLVNTLPGLGLDVERRRPFLGAGAGGMSGPALRLAGLRAVAAARRATRLPLVGVGGVTRAEDAVEYLQAGATLVQVGTASFAAPRAAERVVAGLARWGRRHGVAAVEDLVGSALGGAEREGREPAASTPAPTPVEA